jgi:hypothetical protein
MIENSNVNNSSLWHSVVHSSAKSSDFVVKSSKYKSEVFKLRLATCSKLFMF